MVVLMAMVGTSNRENMLGVGETSGQATSTERVEKRRKRPVRE